MRKSIKFSPEVRERAVRMVLEHRGEYPSLWATIESIAPKIGCVAQTLNEWVRKHEVDAGTRAGVTSDERERLKALERENNLAERLTAGSGFVAVNRQVYILGTTTYSDGRTLYQCAAIALPPK